VWIVQRCLAHYRIPVFDRLSQRLSSRGAALRVLFDQRRLEGPADPTRPYCDGTLETEDRSLLGIVTWRQPRLIPMILAERPVAVFVEGTPRITTNLRVPSACRRVGAASFLWSKGNTEEGTPRGPISDFLRCQFARRFTGIVCYGNASKSEFERLGVPPDRVTVARNTIDTERIFTDVESFARAAAALRRREGLDGRRIVLYCSTMYPKKRQLDLVEAWPVIRAEHPDATLVFVGGGAMLDVVRERARAVDPDGIRVLGRVPEGEDYLWIAACDVSVMCGGLGLAIQQSLAFGKPMIVADEPGVDGEVVEHGVTGWRYQRGDIPALAAAIVGVLRDRDGAAAVAARGRELIRTEVNLDRMVDGFMAALEKAGVLPRSN
jgi:glycosyltransferase involved in cell wall biosynthesis